MRILVADDHPVNRKGMSRMLAAVDLSWHVVQHATAEEAVLAAKNEPFNLIIMDEDFGPGAMTGSQAITSIRFNEAAQGIADDKKAVIVSWTTSTSAAIPPGANSKFDKSATIDDMRAEIDRALTIHFSSLNASVDACGIACPGTKRPVRNVTSPEDKMRNLTLLLDSY